MRTHYCGQINESLVGTSVTLAGWVNRIRNLGGIIFIDLRDREGLVQILVNPQNTELLGIASGLHNEYVISVSGKIQNRPQGIANSELKNGNVEIEAENITVLNSSDSLPFPINETQDTNEDLRLRYRYLDLRRPCMSNKIIERAKITREMRRFLDEKGFVDIETPILTKSTPEGARDYLVPSRVHKGQFYALPQSPQIFKQLLMVSGFDKYYQIARCFRDEDLRADRQLEFTQLDIEMSFVEAKEIRDLTENLMRYIFSQILDTDLPNPFPCLTYKEALSKYGSDKPDLRTQLELVEIKDLLKDIEFSTISAHAKSDESRIASLRVPNGNTISRKKLDGYTEFVRGFGLSNLFYIKINEINLGIQGIQSPILKFIPENIIFDIINRTSSKDGDIIFFAADKITTVNNAMGALRLQASKDNELLDKDSWNPLWVVDFPLFELNNNKLGSMHHPFTAPLNTDIGELKANPTEVTANAYDLVLNGFELGGGSIRISDAKLQMEVFNLLSIDEKEAQSQFGHLLNAFKYGYPPHGGIALGLDRIAMLMSRAESIREVIAFPKTLTASCPLTQAPSKVSQAQLKELGIKCDD